MTVRIGTNPIAWSNDDLLELGSDTPLETCLAEACGCGVMVFAETSDAVRGQRGTPTCVRRQARRVSS